MSEGENESGDAAAFHAKGKVKVEKQGPLKTLALSHIELGQYENELQSVDDTRTYVYVVGSGTLTMAGNFDRERENENPEITVYRKE